MAIFSTVHADEVRRHDSDDLVRRPIGAVEHAQHTRFGRRDDRKAVAPSAVEHRLGLVLELAELHAPGAELAALESDP